MMKIHLIHYKRIFFIHLIAGLLLLLTTTNGTAQQYNDTRVAVILPNVTQTQRPGAATVSTDTRTFCSDDNFFFISSSTTGRKVNHDYSGYLEFWLSSIPEGAIIDTVDLIIYLSQVKNTSSAFEQGVNLYELSNYRNNNQVINIADSSSIAMSLVSKNDVSQAIHLRPDIANGKTWVSERNGNFYCVLAAEEAQTYRYYTERSNDLSKQPKLVISYHMPMDQTRNKNWPQYKYDAQHTAAQGWQSNTTPTSFRINNTYSPSGANYIMSDPLLNDDKLMVYYESSSTSRYKVLTLSQQGNDLGEYFLSTKLQCPPIADRKGYAYYFVGNKGLDIRVFDMHQYLLFMKMIDNDATVVATPVMGFDGSMYISTDKGLYAYTPMPGCKLKWIYGSSANKFGTVALNESEQMVYVYDGASGKLVAVNAVDGVMKWDADVMTKFAQDIPVPSVKNDKVCVTNGLRKGNSFHILDAITGDIVKKVTAHADSAVFSQPVIGTDNIYIINRGLLEGYSLANGEKVSTATITGLNPASALAMDGNNNVYILNTEEGKQSLTVVSPGATTFPSVAIPDSYGYLTGNRLMVAPDGSLITGNNNHIYTIVPTSFAVKGDIAIPADNAFKSEYLYRADGVVQVSGNTIANRQNVVIHGGRGMNFKPGFSVQLGATLTCKAGL